MKLSYIWHNSVRSKYKVYIEKPKILLNLLASSLKSLNIIALTKTKRMEHKSSEKHEIKCENLIRIKLFIIQWYSDKGKKIFYLNIC